MAEDDSLEEELRTLRRIFSDYVENSLESAERRRAENIQILVALGILAGFLTLYVQEYVQDSPLRLFFWLIGGSSAFFLLLKTLIPPLTLENSSGHLHEFDTRWSLFLYVFFVSVSITVLITLLAPIPSVPDIDRQVIELAIAIIGLVVSVYSSYKYSKNVEDSLEEQKERRIRIHEFADNVRESDIQMLIESDPTILGDDIESIEHIEPQVGQRRPDLVARNRSGTPVLVEITANEITLKNIDKLKSLLQEYSEIHPDNPTPRGLIVGPASTMSANHAIKGTDQIKIIDLK